MRTDKPGHCARRDDRVLLRMGLVIALIEVEIADMTVRFGRGADAKAVAAVLRVLKAGT
jgi:hypothetical protein